MDSRFLFRGRALNKIGDKRYDGWLIGSLVENWQFADKIMPTVIRMSNTDYRDRFYAIEVDPATVGQCTGLSAAKSYRGCDPEDRLIYEGDILTSSEYPHFRDGKRNYDCIVFWSDENLMWEYEYRCVNPDVQGISDGICYPLSDLGSFEGLEIVGTIHEQDNGGCDG